MLTRTTREGGVTAHEMLVQYTQAEVLMIASVSACESTVRLYTRSCAHGGHRGHARVRAVGKVRQAKNK